MSPVVGQLPSSPPSSSILICTSSLPVETSVPLSAGAVPFMGLPPASASIMALSTLARLDAMSDSSGMLVQNEVTRSTASHMDTVSATPRTTHVKNTSTWMVLEMARPTAAAPTSSFRPTENRQVATTSTAPKKSHQKASHRWHCSVLNRARWWVLMRATFSWMKKLTASNALMTSMPCSDSSTCTYTWDAVSPAQRLSVVAAGRYRNCMTPNAPNRAAVRAA
mmetsp:Transcript_13475/g.33016  ORF Transcript_13475/g.33016 Transcript_13475/m.33016 type:complete len:223 (-) Transcript_13475:3078-3746(-)